MNLMKRSISIASLSALAVGLTLGAAGVANARSIDVTANLTNVNGSVTSGSNATSGPGNVNATLDFTIPSGQLGQDASDLAGSSNSVDFTNIINGDITGTPVGTISGTLTANNTFSDGSSLADFLLGNTGYVSFGSATLDATVAGTPLSLDLNDPQGQVTNLTFSGSSQDLTTITGGTLLLSGNQSTLAGLNVDGDLENGSGSIEASGSVEGGGGPPTPPSEGVPAPSGLAMLLFMGLALGVMGFAIRRKSIDTEGSKLGV